MESPALDRLNELLTERRDLVNKLEKLKKIKHNYKPNVFKKVMDEYQNRLRNINGEIEQMRSGILKILKKMEEEKSNNLREKMRLEDELEEAKLRYSVGEYDEAIFRAIEEEKMREIEEWNEKLRTIEDKIITLQSVLEERVSIPTTHKEEKIVEEPVKVPEQEIIQPEEEIEEGLEEIESLLNKTLTPVEEKAKRTSADKSEKSEEAFVSEKLLDELGEKEGEKNRIVCQKCGHENPPDSYFCEECGSELIIEDIGL